MKKSVLVIDDDLNACRDLKSALEDEETEVHYALSTDEALCAFMKWNFCLVIINSSLPESNGCEVLKIIRQTKAIALRLPAELSVVLTAGSAQAKGCGLL